MMLSMCIPNVIVLYILAPEIKKDLKEYLETHKFPFAKKLVKFYSFISLQKIFDKNKK